MSLSKIGPFSLTNLPSHESPPLIVTKYTGRDPDTGRIWPRDVQELVPPPGDWKGRTCTHQRSVASTITVLRS